MPPEFAATALPLNWIFADPFRFEAPAYQRSFCWTVKEAGRLIDDLLAAYDEAAAKLSASYFLGAILVVDRGATPPDAPGWPWRGLPRPFDIVDGQQRLATLTILLAVLRDLLAEAMPDMAARLQRHIVVDAPRQDRPGLVSLRGMDNAFLATYVQSQGALDLEPDGDALSASEQSLNDVREHFAHELGERGPEQLARFAIFLLESCSAVMIVTRHVDRAHHMFSVLNDTGKPLARNDILKAEMLGQVSGAGRERCTAAWEGLERALGSDFESLFSHIRTMHGKPGADINSGVRSVVDACGGAEAFIEGTLVPAGGVIGAILRCEHSGARESVEIAQLLHYLGWLNGADWVPPAMAFWLRNPGDPKGLLAFLRQIDRFSYLTRIVGLGVDRRGQRFAAVTAAVRAGRDAMAIAATLDLSRDEMRTADHMLGDLYARSPQICKLVLLRLNDSLRGAPQRLDPEGLTIEHVLPLKPGTTSVWRTSIPDLDVRIRLAGSIGNLTLVTKAVNDRARNLDFERKKAAYFGPNCEPIAHMSESLRDLGVWRGTEIKTREVLLFRHLDKLWKTDLANQPRDDTPDTVSSRWLGLGRKTKLR